ncbi:MAG TPA: hypothetical protein VGW76_04940 [Pyrinomonadaceae bacterium]|nr:hypothetical protein [Pyrinomonadaceae bacterium]
MTLTFRYISVVICFLVISLLAAPIVRADNGNEELPEVQQEDAWLNDVPCKDPEGLFYINHRRFQLCFRFDPSELQVKPGSVEFWPTIHLDSYTQTTNKNLTDISLTVNHPEDHPGLDLDTGKALPEGETQKLTDLTSIRKFVIKIGIKNARSDKYPLSLSLMSDTDAADRLLEYRLPVLAADKRSVVVERIPPANEIECWAGKKCSDLEIRFTNSLPYKLTITKVTIRSKDLLDPNSVSSDNSPLEPNSEKDVTFYINANSMTFPRVFSGFGKPQLTMKIEYEDEHKRPLQSETTMEFQIKPNVLVIIILLLLGAAVGTIVRIDLGRLQRAGVISRKERLIFAGTTFASGILVCAIALFANIKLVVLNDQNSYSAWDPKILFFTALIATVSGLPILYAYMRIPRQAGAGGSTQQRQQPQPPETHQQP